MNHSRFDMRKRRARVLYVENKKKVFPFSNNKGVHVETGKRQRDVYA